MYQESLNKEALDLSVKLKQFTFYTADVEPILHKLRNDNTMYGSYLENLGYRTTLSQGLLGVIRKELFKYMW